MLSLEDVHFYRALAEYEIGHEVLNGGATAAKRVAREIFEAIKLLPGEGTAQSVEPEIG